MDKTKDRLYELMAKRGITQSDIVNRTGIPKSSVSMYVAGTRTPKQDKIAIIANAYNINPVWLMGFDVPMEKEKNDAYNLGATMADIVTGSDEDMSEVMEYYSKISKLTKEQKECVYDFIDVLIAKNESAE